MNRTASPKKEIPPDIYTKQYYMTDNEGCWEYTKDLDANMHHKYKRPLELAEIKPDDHVLDIGCGRGELIYYALKQQAATAMGIDYSQAAIDLAQQTILRLPIDMQKKAEARVADVVQYTFPRKYDVIFMIDVAEHLFDWQLVATFQKIYELLNDNGRLILVTPNIYYEKYLQPLKKFLDIPFRLIKWPLRILRRKYKPKNFAELCQKIFSIKTDRGAVNRMMHANVLTPKRLKEFLSDFQTIIRCEDHSRNPISLLLCRYWGLNIVAVAKK
jgi:2-polyprenyl-3-methyl-5-hydroxy-6-metoxy-1,4-benzoquinol methylase